MGHKLFTVYAAHDFRAESEDELTFFFGEPVFVLQKDEGFNDGWWKGENAKGETGLFPSNFIVNTFPASLVPTGNDKEKPIVFSGQLKESVRRSLLNPELNSAPGSWTADQVEAWLADIDFTYAADNFKSLKITGDILLGLDTMKLKELGVPTFGKRFKLQMAIKYLKEYTVPVPQEHGSKHMSSKQGNIDPARRSPSILPIEPTSLKQDSLEMQGWLYKQGCKYKTWNKRWFILKGPNLFYFKSPKVDVRMKGVINLRGYRVMFDESIQPGKYSFKMEHEQERTFCFYAEVDSVAKRWMNSLMKSTISRDYTKPVISSRLIPAVPLDVARQMRPRPPSLLLYESKCWQDVNHDSGFDSEPPLIESEDEGIDIAEDSIPWTDNSCDPQERSAKTPNSKTTQRVTSKPVTAVEI
ncbi:hypothetical protein BY458DRAFT_490325 [Sporodiniella umbellata]|nr:hypothetical protein BY458DRAFT_490325 [Sporodiniella umbellata]